MNICILKESLTIGGTERSAANISKILDNDHHVTIALYDGSDIKYSYAGNLLDFELPPKSTRAGKILNTFLRERVLRKVIKVRNINILYTFTAIGNYQTKFKYKDIIKIISARDFGKMSRECNKYNFALKNSDAMICNSEYTKNFYISKYPKDADKVYAVYNYIDAEEILKQSEDDVENDFLTFIKEHEKTIVSVGRFCKEKGFEYLIEAFAKARENDGTLGLVLVGDGDYKEKYIDAIKRFNVEKDIYFTGFQKNPYKYMVKCSCFVLSSLSEGFPNVLAEAMALGLPVIATNCLSGPAEILRMDNDYNAVTDKYEMCDFGIVTPRITADHNNPIEQLGKAINELLSNKELIERYSLLSAKRAADFSEEAARGQLNSIFDELICRRKK